MGYRKHIGAIYGIGVAFHQQNYRKICWKFNSYAVPRIIGQRQAYGTVTKSTGAIGKRHYYETFETNSYDGSTTIEL